MDIPNTPVVVPVLNASATSDNAGHLFIQMTENNDVSEEGRYMAMLVLVNSFLSKIAIQGGRVNHEINIDTVRNKFISDLLSIAPADVNIAGPKGSGPLS